jgi:hypothetical protein
LNGIAIETVAIYATALSANGLKGLKSNENAGHLMADRHVEVAGPFRQANPLIP